jgi:hypothetical protein
LYIGLIVGTLISEVFCSGSLSDRIVIKLAKSNNNQKTPEMRLWLAYPAALLTAVGLIVWGLSVDRVFHWMVGQVAFALCKLPCAYVVPCALCKLKLMIVSVKLVPVSRWETLPSVHMWWMLTRCRAWLP